MRFIHHAAKAEYLDGVNFGCEHGIRCIVVNYLIATILNRERMESCTMLTNA